jgi:hypothetical protein
LLEPASVVRLFRRFADPHPFPFVEMQRALRLGWPEAKLDALLDGHGRLCPGHCIRRRGLSDGGLLVARELLFPRRARQYLFGCQKPGEPEAVWLIPPEQLPELASFIREAAHSSPKRVRSIWPGEPPSVFLASRKRPPGPRLRRPGIYRREHACLAIRSRTTTVLVDPIDLAGVSPAVTRPLPALSEPVHAVAITHGHEDHWHLPSALTAAGGPEVPVIVPRVPRANLLCLEDFQKDLARCGQSVRAPGWHSSIRIGDILVDVLPFYGEQPTRDAPGPAPELRSWGNCYRFTTEDFSCVVLADSGIDPLGSVVDALAASRLQRGPVDVVLACQREFASPFFGGLATYWAALPYRRLQTLQAQMARGRLPSTTAGIPVLVEVCRVAGAEFFLPYANGYQGPGRAISDIGWGQGEPSEESCSAKMNATFRRKGMRTRAPQWNPGDAWVLGPTGLARAPFVPHAR